MSGFAHGIWTRIHYGSDKFASGYSSSLVLMHSEVGFADPLPEHGHREVLTQLKDYRYHDFPNTEFSYFLTIDTRQ